MLDSSLISLLLGILAVVGTLGGALGGTILANRHATKLEELRIAQEKLKRNTALIEEAYSLVTRINYKLLDNINLEQIVLIRQVISDDLLRVQTIIYVYLPALKDKYSAFSRSIYDFKQKVDEEQTNKNNTEISKKLSEQQAIYMRNLKELLLALASLVN